MEHRLLDVTSYTTFDLVDARADGADWTDEAAAVLDVHVPDGEPATVLLEVELDPADLDRVDHHADAVLLSPERARTLAAALEDAADTASGSGN